METHRRACAHVFRAAYCPCLQVGRESGPSTKGALPAKGSVAAKGTFNMKISARNQLKGTIANIQEGAVNGVVTLDIEGNRVKADITMEAIKDLGLAVGGTAFAIIKASSVMFADGEIKGISARNQLRGEVVEVKEGAVNGHVAIQLPGGQKVKGSITNEAIEQLGLKVGAQAVAIIKATEVMVGVE